MRVKILNKNNNQWFQIDEGSVFTETKNETLDSATIIINNVSTKLEINPYDVVEIQNNANVKVKYMCVDTYTETMVCVKPKLYRYDITLFSETKLLEGTVLPSLKITKMPGISRSIYYYIDQYLTEYCPVIRIQNNDSYTISSKYDWTYQISGELAPHLQAKFDDECPEMQWNTPTLREVLNDLMMVKDCIVILKDGKIDYIELSEVGKDRTNDEYINYVTRSKSSEDYVSELQITLKNVTNQQAGTKNTVTRVEYVPFSADQEDVALKTSNAAVRTRYPIYKLKSLKMIWPGYYMRTAGATEPYEVNQWMEYDLCTIRGFVTEYQEYITKPVLYYASGNDNLGDSQNLSIYYTRGTNKIEGFFYNTKFFLWMAHSLFFYLIETLTIAKLPADDCYLPTGWDACKYYQVMFKVEYETLDECLVRASKSEVQVNERVVIDNQTNSMVDSYAQGFLEYQKANRLGNEQLQINARYPSDTPASDLLKLGDLFENTVVYQVQYQYFKDHTEVNALATKDYILREYFTGVKSKIRSWVIASGSEALVRHELTKFYCEFSWSKYNTKYTNVPIRLYVENFTYFYSPLTSYDPDPLQYAAVQLKSPRQTWIPEAYPVDNVALQTYYCMDLISRVVGNSMVFTFGFEDNCYLEKSVDTSIINLQTLSISDSGIIDWADTIDLGGVPLEQYKYTDDIGEVTSCEVTFATGLKIIPFIPVNDGGKYLDPQDMQTINPAEDQRRQFQFYSYLRPRITAQSLQQRNDAQQINWDYRRLFTKFDHHKDSQEIMRYSTQFEFCSDTNDLCFGKEWLLRQKMINTNVNKCTYELNAYNLNQWSNNPQKFDFRRPDKQPDDLDRLAGGATTIEFSLNSDGTYNIELTSPEVFNTEDDAKDYFLTRRNWAWYLVVKTDNEGQIEYSRGNEPVLLAFTNIPTENVSAYTTSSTDPIKYGVKLTIHMNVLKTRNKNIYDEDNHYLIVDKI